MRRVAVLAVAVVFGTGVAPALAAETDVLPDNTVAYWTLNEKTGTTAFDAAGDQEYVDPDGNTTIVPAHDGTYVNGPTLGVAGAPEPFDDTGVYFNGTSQYVQVPYSPYLTPTKADGTLAAFSAEAWVKPGAGNFPPQNGSVNESILCSRNSIGTRGFMLYIGNYVGRPQFAFVVGHGTTRRYVYDELSSALAPDVWHHVIASFNPDAPAGSQLRLYVDDRLVGSGDRDDEGGGSPGPPPAGYFPNPGEPTYIAGCSGTNGVRDYFQGTLNGVAIYRGPYEGTRFLSSAYRLKRPVIFIPGSLGSFLKSRDCLGFLCTPWVEAWPSVIQMLAQSNDDYLNDLKLNDNGIEEANGSVQVAVAREIGIKGVIDKAKACGPHLPCPGFLEEPQYEPTFKYLTTGGYPSAPAYRLGKDLFPFAYDWRRGARWNAYCNGCSLFNNDLPLSELIDKILDPDGQSYAAGYRKVDIIAHSQGGLVATTLAQSAEPQAFKIRRIVTLGTPYLGAAKFLSILRWRTPCEIKIKVISKKCRLSPAKVQEIAKNFPGVLQLLPSPIYDYIVGRTVRWNGHWMSWDDVVNAILTVPYLNRPLIIQAGKFHWWISGNRNERGNDDWNPADPNLRLLRIIGVGHDTIKAIRRTTRCVRPANGPCVYHDHIRLLTSSLGDGTVHAQSSALCNYQTGANLKGSAPNWFVEGRDSTHMGLVQSPEIMLRAILFLRGYFDPSGEEPLCARRPAVTSSSTLGSEPAPAAGSTTSDGPTTEAASADLAETAPEDGASGGTAPATAPANVAGCVAASSTPLESSRPPSVAGTQVETQTLDGRVADSSGRVLAAPVHGEDVQPIPGASYNDWLSDGDLPPEASLDASNELYFLPCSDSYHGAWTVTRRDMDTFVTVRDFVEESVVTVATTGPIDVRLGALLTMDFTRPVQWSSLVVRIDDNADGVVDRTVPFLPPVSGAGADDDIPPTSSVSVKRTMAKKCLASAQVTITATDEGGAGVARILYNAPDLGISHAVYTGPVTLPPRGELYAWAVDGAGNVEDQYHFAVLDDRPTFREHVAEFLVPHVNATGCLDYPGDVDWWGFEVAAGTHQFQLIGLKNDYDIALYGANGALLATSERRGQMSEKIRVDLAAGRYFLRVRGYAGAWNDQHPYRINVTKLGGGATTTTTTSTTTSSGGSSTTSEPSTTSSTSTGPSGLWRLGDPAGSTTAADATGRLNHGSYVGEPALGGGGALYGDGDAAATFNGTSQYVEAPWSETTNAKTFSVEAWANPSGGSGTRRAVVTSHDLTGGATGYGLYAGEDNRWQARLGDGTTWRIVSGGSVAIGTWTHLAATYDGATARLYVNGSLAATLATGFAPNPGQPLRIAAGPADGTTQYFFPGAVDEVAAYDRVRTDDELSADYGAGFAPTNPTYTCGRNMYCIEPVPTEY
jgi:hypothetical protein